MVSRRALVGLLTSVVATSGCMLFRVGDGLLRVDGHVYEAAGAADTGVAIEVDASNTSELGTGRGVEGCRVMVMPWRPGDRRSSYSVDLWTRRATLTDATGRFSVGGTSAPGWYDATLYVECAGFPPVTHVFRHDRFWHTATVRLVREAAPGARLPHNNEMQRTKPAQATELRR